MKTALSVALAALVASPPLAARNAIPPARQIQDFDDGWRFIQGEETGAETPGFEDGSWPLVALPHDWSIKGPVAEDNPSGRGGGFFPTGVGWYRKRFVLPSGAADRRVAVEFDGVMANSDVWINGHLLGHRPYGYISFCYDLTPYLNIGGATNLIAVRADDSKEPASRWYPGAGIYRHVRLVSTGMTRFEPWGIAATTPAVDATTAQVHIQASVSNASRSDESLILEVQLENPDGKVVSKGQSLAFPAAGGASGQASVDLNVERPALWDIDHPLLYHARVRLRNAAGRAGEWLDSEEVVFGVRSARFDAATGFWLNGRNVKLKGVCLHDDGSAFGAAVPLDVWRLRLAALKKMGANAIRTAHNPPAPEFLDLCDQMGFLVMDEAFDCWTVGKNPFDYHLAFAEWSKTDARDMVRRDRNHPSIVLWSAGNEIHDTPQQDLAKGILSGLVAIFHENDPSRPVTQALFRPNVSHDYDDGLSDMLDVVGTNYRYNELLAAHAKKPSIRIIGTENRHDAASWLAVLQNAPYAGEFIWSGFDYLGEARAWPSISSDEGLIDRTGEPHADGMIVRSWWSDQPVIWVARRVAPNAAGEIDPGYGPLATTRRRSQVLFPDWSPTGEGPHEESVEVYSNCPEVELIQNGRSLGSMTRSVDLAPRVWKVPFEPGELTALGKIQGRLMVRSVLHTAGEPAKLRLRAIGGSLHPGWDHVVQVVAEVTDAKGERVPGSRNQVSFTVTGPGELVAVDSADPDDHEPFQGSVRTAYEGRCVAYVRADRETGKLSVSASTPGLTPAAITLPIDGR